MPTKNVWHDQALVPVLRGSVVPGNRPRYILLVLEGKGTLGMFDHVLKYSMSQGQELTMSDLIGNLIEALFITILPGKEVVGLNKTSWDWFPTNPNLRFVLHFC
jgi:hypothetical protein